MLAKAIQFAAKKHEYQERKFTGEDYINHPIQVMLGVLNDPVYGSNDFAAAVAILHDVIEDCGSSREAMYLEIDEKFGPGIASAVYALTNEYTSERHPQLNRQERKAREVKRLAKLDDLEKTIKAYDRLANLKDTLANLKDTLACSKEEFKFARKYSLESIELAKALITDENKKLIQSLLCYIMLILKFDPEQDETITEAVSLTGKYYRDLN